MASNPTTLHQRRGGVARIGEMYSVEGDIVPDPTEQMLLAAANHLRNKGLPLRKVAEELSKSGFRNRRGNPFTTHNVWWIFNRPSPSTN